MRDESCAVYLAYKDYDENIKEEAVTAVKEGENYRLTGIPIFASNLAVDDLISVAYDEGKLYFLDLIRPSGHSTVQIVFFDESKYASVITVLEKNGCRCASVDADNYLSADIPDDISYGNIRSVLDFYAGSGILDFKEACLGDRLME
jgi:hypothetical protein